MEAERDNIVSYIARYGGQCRDCADENGVCPNSGLPCAGAEKAIRHVLKALDYGIKHGYLPAAHAAPLPSADAVDAASERSAVLEYVDQVETELMEVVNGQRKPGKLSLEPIVRLCTYARNGTTQGASIAATKETP